jgi:hypothetical protein
MAKHGWTPPQPNDGVEGHLYAHRAVKASRQFLQANPEGGRSLPRPDAWNAAADHLYKYPGDLPLFEGTKGSEGTGKRGK